MQLRVAGRASPWLTILVAGAAAAVGAVALRCASTPSPSRASQETMGEMGAIPSHAIHVELAPGATLPGSHPVFTHLPPGTHDERTRWRIVDVDASVAVALAELAVDPRVVEAFLEPDIAPMIEDDAVAQRAPNDGDDGDRCPITTPAYDELQGYVGPAPYGIDAPFAWRAGFRGGHVWFADVEGGWNAAHEDLPGDRITHVGGRSMTDPSWSAHGTAVLGEVVGRDNRKGVTGLAPDVERVFTSSIAGQTVADAIDAAAEPLRPGDVLLIELQSTGPRGRYLPVEYWNDVYAAIRAATDRGVVVIEAAGNGGEDLDRSIYRGKLSRKGRDSGAIMVGAGAPPRPGFVDRTRLDFSNYGSRVDVQGWGRRVATLDYGDLQACDDRVRDRHYTGEFSGTSSASPIVAGAAILLEDSTGRALTPREVRARLTATGTPQTGDVSEAIGPRPDLARALP
jgi:subtilisin family serine protease